MDGQERSDIGLGASGHHDRCVRSLRVVPSEGIQWLFSHGGYKTKHCRPWAIS
jgi:hypothetical protein